MACRAWILLTTCFLVGNGAIVLLLGSARLHDLVQEGPLSRLSLTLVSVAIAWLVVGAALFALGNRALRERHWLTVLCAFFVLMLYANILRERLAYAEVARPRLHPARERGIVPVPPAGGTGEVGLPAR